MKQSNQKISSEISYVIFALTLATLSSPLSHAGAPVSRARAAELSLHRIENLVTLKKIHPSHVARMKTLELSVLARANDDEPAFQVLATQYPGSDGSQYAVQIPLKIDGKALKHTETLGTETVVAPTWPTLDAVTLAENALHCVQGEKLDNARPDLCVHPEIAAYEATFGKLSISQEVTSAGPIAVIDVQAASQTGSPSRILRIRLKADGVPINDSPISFIE